MQQTIEAYRKELDTISEELLSLLAARQEIVKNIGALKKNTGLAIYQPQREQEMYKRITQTARTKGLNPTMAVRIFRTIISESKKLQTRI